MTTRRGRIAITGPMTLLAFCGVGQSVQQTEAAWTSEAIHGAQLITGIVNPVTSLTCKESFGVLTSEVAFYWPQPVVTGNAIVPTRYTVVWSGSPGGGQKVATSRSASVPLSTQLSVATTSNAVVNVNANGWSSVVSTESRAISTTFGLLGANIVWFCA